VTPLTAGPELDRVDQPPRSDDRLAGVIARRHACLLRDRRPEHCRGRNLGQEVKGVRNLLQRKGSKRRREPFMAQKPSGTVSTKKVKKPGVKAVRNRLGE